VAKIARVDSSTVRRWAESGELQSVKTPGGHFRFNAEYIRRRFAAQNEDAA
jgi:excisionase family DNA binding protein